MECLRPRRSQFGETDMILLVMVVLFLFCLLYIYIHTHTHTHTHIYIYIYIYNGHICTRVRTGFLANQIAWLPVNIYSIQTGCINWQIFWPCQNVNKTFTAHKFRKTDLTGNSASSTRMAKWFLTKMMAQAKISVLTGPKRTMQRTKSAAREKGFNILLIHCQK